MKLLPAHVVAELPDNNEPLPLAGKTRVSIRAMFLGERMELKTLELGHRLGASPLVVEAGSDGIAVLFKYGVVVCFGIPPVEEASLLRHLRELVSEPFDECEEEEVMLDIAPNADERAEGGTIRLKELTIERLQVVSDILAKSVVLAHYEDQLNQVFDKVEPLAARMETGRIRDRSGKALLRHIGGSLLVQTKMVARVGVTDKPELLWERPELELLYARLEDEYELPERHVALERKLALVSQTAETLLEVLANRHSLRVEWYIVILIVVEIILTLYQMFWSGGH